MASPITGELPGIPEKGNGAICEDRRGQAIVESLSIRKNTVLSRLDHYAKAGVMDSKQEISDTQDQIRALDIKTKGINQVVRSYQGQPAEGSLRQGAAYRTQGFPL